MVGNEYYKLRLKDGRDKKYSPEALLKKANEYFSWVLENPFKETQVVKGNFTEEKDGEKITKPYVLVEVPKMRPFTLEGFCNFADIALNTFKNYEKIELPPNAEQEKVKEAEDYLIVTSRIRQMIENHQFEGAASGFLNHNIIASKLGLIRKQEISGNPEKPLMGLTPRKVIIEEHNNA